MSVKINPVASTVIILAVIGAIFAVFLVITNQRPPHLPTGMGAAMQQAGANRGPTGQANKE